MWWRILAGLKHLPAKFHAALLAGPANRFPPWGARIEEVAALLSRTREAATSGAFEKFKTETRFDSTAHHPRWRG